MARWSRWVAVTVAIAIAMLAYLPWNGSLRIPERWNPWAPLSPDDAPNILTRYKLDRLQDNAPACLATLQRTTLRYTVLPDRSDTNGCGWNNAVRITETPTRLSQPFVLSCPAAVALALWEHHSVQALALQYFNEPVTRIDHQGSFACRNIGGEENGRKSEHARANALDVSGFVLADGASVRVSDWRGDDVRAHFLHDVHAGACRFWNVALGPGYNAAHRDHFHLDRGPFRACSSMPVHDPAVVNSK